MRSLRDNASTRRLLSLSILLTASAVLLPACVSNVELPLPGIEHPANPEAAAAPEMPRPGMASIAAPPAKAVREPEPAAPSHEHHHHHNM